VVKAQKQYRWITAADFATNNPIRGMLTGFFQGTSDKGKPTNVALLKTDQHGLRQFELWGESMNALIDAWGDETDAWMGRRLEITATVDPTTGKGRRIVKALN